MIPASYLYKDVFTQAWGDPRGPRGGHFAGLAELLASVRPLETQRHRLTPVHR